MWLAKKFKKIFSIFFASHILSSYLNFKPKSLKGLKILDIIITMLDIRQTTTMLHLLGHIMAIVDMVLIISIILDIIKTILDNRQTTTMLDHLGQIMSIVDMVLISLTIYYLIK